jgi:hypothetical protein
MFCDGRDLCDGLITRPEESYQVYVNRLRNLPCEAAKVLTRTAEPLMMMMMMMIKGVVRFIRLNFVSESRDLVAGRHTSLYHCVFRHISHFYAFLHITFKPSG